MQHGRTKKSYKKPSLIVHGSIASMTQQKGGGKGKNPVHDAFGSRGGIA
jgi:hypothetical protein